MAVSLYKQSDRSTVLTALSHRIRNMRDAMETAYARGDIEDYAYWAQEHAEATRASNAIFAGKDIQPTF